MSADPPRGPPPSEGAVPNTKTAPPIVRSMPLRGEWDRSVPLPAGVSEGQREVGSGSSRTDGQDSEEGGGSGKRAGEAIREEEGEGEPEPCSVCQGPLPEEGLGLITCGHAFCFKCILRWSKNENTCPQCRQKFFSIIKTLTDEEHEELEKKLEGQGAKSRDDSKSKKKRRKRKLPAFMSEVASKKTKTVRVRSRSQAQQFGRAQANTPHPQAPGGFLHGLSASLAHDDFMSALDFEMEAAEPGIPEVRVVEDDVSTGVSSREGQEQFETLSTGTPVRSSTPSVDSTSAPVLGPRPPPPSGGGHRPSEASWEPLPPSAFSTGGDPDDASLFPLAGDTNADGDHVTDVEPMGSSFRAQPPGLSRGSSPPPPVAMAGTSFPSTPFWSGRFSSQTAAAGFGSSGGPASTNEIFSRGSSSATSGIGYAFHGSLMDAGQSVTPEGSTTVYSTLSRESYPPRVGMSALHGDPRTSSEQQQSQSHGRGMGFSPVFHAHGMAGHGNHRESSVDPRASDRVGEFHHLAHGHGHGHGRSFPPPPHHGLADLGGNVPRRFMEGGMI